MKSPSATAYLIARRLEASVAAGDGTAPDREDGTPRTGAPGVNRTFVPGPLIAAASPPLPGARGERVGAAGKGSPGAHKPLAEWEFAATGQRVSPPPHPVGNPPR